MPRCVMCNYVGEDGWHLFLRCKHVKDLWCNAGLEEVRQRLLACRTAMETVKMILALRSGIRLKVIFLLYNWWNERNSVREGEKRRQAAHIAGLSWKQAMEIENLHKPMQQESGVRRRMRKWQRPQAGKLKINVDGAFRELDKNGGWGYVIRDEDGRVIQSGSGRQRYACNAMQMELRACIEGVKAAIGIWSLERIS